MKPRAIKIIPADKQTLIILKWVNKKSNYKLIKKISTTENLDKKVALINIPWLPEVWD